MDAVVSSRFCVDAVGLVIDCSRQTRGEENVDSYLGGAADANVTARGHRVATCRHPRSSVVEPICDKLGVWPHREMINSIRACVCCSLMLVSVRISARCLHGRLGRAKRGCGCSISAVAGATIRCGSRSTPCPVEPASSAWWCSLLCSRCRGGSSASRRKR